MGIVDRGARVIAGYLAAPFLDVLEVLVAASEHDTEVSGHEIARAAQRCGVTIYHYLDSMEGARWLTSRWQSEGEGEGQGEGAARHRLYRLTPDGLQGARFLLRIHRPPGSPPSLRRRILARLDVMTAAFRRI